jgi:hypothetical protein
MRSLPSLRKREFASSAGRPFSAPEDKTLYLGAKVSVYPPSVKPRFPKIVRRPP